MSSLYALKYGFGKIIFCKKDKKIEIVKEVEDLKTRTLNDLGKIKWLANKVCIISERIFYMR